MLNSLKVFGAGLLVGLILFLAGQCENAREVSDLRKAYNASHEKAQIWKDKFERSHARLSVTELSLQDAKRLEAKLFDSLRLVTGIKPKHTHSVVTVTKFTTDTVVVSRSRFGNKWASFQWIDSSRLAYAIKDSLLLVRYDRRFGFLNLRSKTTIQAVSFNPHTTLTGMRSLEIVPPRRRLSFGINGGYGLMLSAGEIRAGLYIGAGLSYRLF